MENVADIYPLSPSQEGMLFHTLAEPGSGVYVEQYVCTLRGPLREEVFRPVWKRAVERHAVLRTAFLWEGLDEPLQVVRREVEIPWRTEDWRGLDDEEQRRRFDAFLEEDRVRGFEPARAPLLRMTLVRTGEETHRFVWSFHHLLLDGWSTALVFNEVLADYAAQCQGQPIALAAPRPFRDYIAWLQEQDLAAAETFWKDTLGGFDTPTPLAVDRPAPRGSSSPYAQQETTLSVDVTDQLTSLARQHRLTMNTVVQGAWALLLSRYSGGQDIVHGTTVAGRPPALPGVERMVGAFINTLPVRTKVEPSMGVMPWLRTVQEHLLAAKQYEHTPLIQIQRWSDVPGGRALFESLVVFENFPQDTAAPAAAVDLYAENALYLDQSNYPLALLVVPGPTLRLLAVYDTARFEADAVVRILEHLATILQSIVSTPEATLGTLSLLPDAERTELLAAAHGAPRTALPEGGVLALIEQHARDTPEATAVALGDERLTYAKLWEDAGQLAGHLRTLGVGPNVPVGVCLKRSPALLVGILGVLRAGGAYIPLDPKYPAERLQFMLEDASALALVTRTAHRDLFSDTSAHIVDIDHALGETEGPEPSALGDLAYVIYTSGSTGQPKGVGVTHHNLAHSTQARLDYYDEPVASFLLLSSVAFDSSVAGIFWTLASGGTLVLPAERLEQDVSALAALVARHGVTHTLCLPSLYRVILDLASPTHLASLRCVIAAGEAFPPDLAARHYDKLPHAGLYNEYGPTEATVWATVHRVSDADTERVPIGRPIPGAQAYVLDPHGDLTPFGVPGELYLGGDGVTPGYLGRPERTAEAFVPDPFGEGRLYRTGDRVRWRPDGTLDFLGRVDNQVKVRGHRIELGEVEAALRQHPAILDAVAVVHNGTPQPDSRTLGSEDVETLAARLGALDLDEAERLLAEVGEGAIPDHAALTSVPSRS